MCVLMALATVMFIATGADAQDYPTRPVKVIIPFSVGSATDVLARAVSRKLSEIWGQAVVNENLPGQGGTLAAAVVAEALPDGYTLFVHGAYAINPSFYSNLPYDPLKDFTDIAPLARQPLVLVVGPSSSPDSVSGLIALAKSKSGQLKYGSPGTGSAAHLAAEKFMLAAGIDMKHVPYKGGPEVIAATNAGDIIFSFLPAAIAKKSVEKGKLVALGATSVQRVSAMPEMPTITEAGLAGFEFNLWWGLWAPAAIPAGVLDKIEKDVARSLAMPGLKELFSKLAAEPMHMTSAEFRKFVRSELESVARTVKETGIKPE
jgi:tripartite-type tricarboxylate transporter receptor subunit TctC